MMLSLHRRMGMTHRCRVFKLSATRITRPTPPPPPPTPPPQDETTNLAPTAPASSACGSCTTTCGNKSETTTTTTSTASCPSSTMATSQPSLTALEDHAAREKRALRLALGYEDEQEEGDVMDANVPRALQKSAFAGLVQAMETLDKKGSDEVKEEVIMEEDELEEEEALLGGDRLIDLSTLPQINHESDGMIDI